uniref:Uncharacterized protein n=1 Tax=Arundo donax TaxID=35708 RepID=A0A0A8Z4D0_ARUDO
MQHNIRVYVRIVIPSSSHAMHHLRAELITSYYVSVTVNP